MYIQAKGTKDYHKINEILYVLHAADAATKQDVSKIALQKLLYLSACLAPIKNVILSFLRFKRIDRGPYSKDIQNLVDHLVACDLVELTRFKITKHKNSIAHYRITEGGKKAVSLLMTYSLEEERIWWIRSVVKLSVTFSTDKNLAKDGDYSGLDKIVYLVYQEETFKDAKENKSYKALINFEESKGTTSELINSIKEYMVANVETLGIVDERKGAELILLGFFEHFLSNYIAEQSNGDTK